MDRHRVLKKQFYFDCKCWACKKIHPIKDTAPKFIKLDSGGVVDLLRLPEQGVLRIYNKACQYLCFHGHLSGHSDINLKVLMVKHVLVLYFYVLMNNLPLKWKFGDLQSANVALHNSISSFNNN